VDDSINRSLTFSRLVGTLALIFVSGVVLAHFYQLVAFAVGSTRVSAAIIHLALGIGALSMLKRHLRPDKLMVLPNLWLLSPALVILLGSIALALGSTLIAPPSHRLPIAHEQWVSILVIPVIEEIFFRGVLGVALRNQLGNLWGGYYSALLFSWVHSLPTLDRISIGQSGLVFGPLLLGLMCEVLMVRGNGRIIPPTALHMVCNATVPVFALIDSRWLQWLSFLYQ
jgi:membrane protease YdiL (CAAX protease family)